MINKARGECEVTLGKKKIIVAMTLKAASMLENFENEKDLDAITGIIAEMTQGSAKEMTQKQISELTITLPEFKNIVSDATDAASAAMPEGRNLGNGNRKTRKATARKPKAKPRRR